MYVLHLKQIYCKYKAYSYAMCPKGRNRSSLVRCRIQHFMNRKAMIVFLRHFRAVQSYYQNRVIKMSSFPPRHKCMHFNRQVRAHSLSEAAHLVPVMIQSFAQGRFTRHGYILDQTCDIPIRRWFC